MNGTRYYKLATVSSTNRRWPLHIGGSNSGGKSFDVDAAISPSGVIAIGTGIHESAAEGAIKLYYVAGSSGCELYVEVGSYSSVAILSFSRGSILDGSLVDSLPSGAVAVTIE